LLHNVKSWWKKHYFGRIICAPASSEKMRHGSHFKLLYGEHSVNLWMQLISPKPSAKPSCPLWLIMPYPPLGCVETSQGPWFSRRLRYPTHSYFTGNHQAKRHSTSYLHQINHRTPIPYVIGIPNPRNNYGTRGNSSIRTTLPYTTTLMYPKIQSGIAC
jgi:hypothetical protein